MAERDLRLAEPPQWVVMHPQCSACDHDLNTDGDGWTCESCGTTWPMNAEDGEFGVLPDDAKGPVVQNRDAWRFSGDSMTADERDDRIRKFYGEPRAAS